MKLTYSIAFKLNGVWTQDLYFERDIYDEAPLDETLDSGIVVDVPAELRKIPPFTFCRITTTSDDPNEDPDIRYYFTADRETSAVTLFGVDNSLDFSGQKFRQRISLIELTKILEREPCDSLSFTHRLSLIPEDAEYIEAERVTNNSGQELCFNTDQLNTLYMTPRSGSLPIYFINILDNITTHSNYYPDATVYEVTKGAVTVASGTIVPTNTDVGSLCTFVNAGVLQDNQTYTLVYTIYYHFNAGQTWQNYTETVTYTFSQRETTIQKKPIPTITDVINRILNVGQPRPVYIDAKYTLDPNIASLYANENAPEFFFPRMTLFEALLEVGKKIQAIPRLTVSNYGTDEAEPNVITYDLLGLDETYVLPQNAQVVGYKNTQGSEDYCGGLDSYVENHINTIDPNAGSVTEPFDGGYKTLTAESGATVTNANAVFEVSRPIYRVLKFEMAYTTAKQDEVVGNITKYVYEQAEYEGLYTDVGASFPNSKAFALVWKQGDRYIRGFNTASVARLNIIQQFMKPSINNIVDDYRGSGFIDSSQIYSNLAFRLTYIPMDNIRVRQYKPYATHDRKNLLYNQQNANTVEGSFYGENLKGKICRMGNEIEVYTVRFNSYSELPKLGSILLDEEGNEKGYIYKLVNRRAQNYIKSDIYVTQDFNRLGEYFSLNSNFRLFEVSERQSIDRSIIVSRTVNLSLELPEIDNNKPTYITTQGLERFMSTFAQSDNGLGRPTVAFARAVNSNFERVGKYCYALPVNSTACGNSLAFTFAFEDSYKAGKRNVASGVETQDVVLGSTDYWKAVRNIPYGNAYGAFYGLQFALAPTLYQFKGTIRSYEPTYSDQETAGGFCDTLPAVNDETYSATEENAYITTWDTGNDYRKTRVIDKNSSEHISVSVQFHGVCADKKIVMGTAMWNNNLLIRDEPVKELDSNGNPTFRDREKPHIFLLKNKRLNGLRNRIDLSSDDIYDIGVFSINSIIVEWVPVGNEYYQYKGLGIIGRLALPDYVSNITQQTSISRPQCTSWCIADPTNGEIYIGVNEVLKAANPATIETESTSPIYFYFDEEA